MILAIRQLAQLGSLNEYCNYYYYILISMYITIYKKERRKEKQMKIFAVADCRVLSSFIALTSLPC